jgi:hypothetical protein
MKENTIKSARKKYSNGDGNQSTGTAKEQPKTTLRSNNSQKPPTQEG